MACKICGTNHREAQDHPYTGKMWMFLPEMNHTPGSQGLRPSRNRDRN